MFKFDNKEALPIMKNLVVTCLVCFISIGIFSQEYACGFAYKHMSGILGNDAIILDMLIINNEVMGSCVFPDLLVESGDLEGLIRTNRLEGFIDENGVATLQAYSQNIEVGEYSGRLGEEFSGTFRELKSGISLTFDLEEDDYSESIRLKAYCIDRDSMLIDTAGSPNAHLRMSLLLPEKAASMAELRQSIMKAFFGQPLPDTLSDEYLLPAYATAYFTKYIESNKDLYDGGHSFNWEIITSSYVNINTNGFLVYRADNYAYTGGAHGMGISRFLVFDNMANKKLELNDIFDVGFEDELSKLLERKYRIEYYLGPEQSLTEAGLFENDIPPTANFHFTYNGMGFYYNPYELAPYSMGSISIIIPYDELLPLMKIDSPVMRLIK